MIGTLKHITLMHIVFFSATFLLIKCVEDTENKGKTKHSHSSRIRGGGRRAHSEDGRTRSIIYNTDKSNYNDFFVGKHHISTSKTQQHVKRRHITRHGIVVTTGYKRENLPENEDSEPTTPTPNDPACKFPFIYDGVTRYHCQGDRNNPKQTWCSLTSNYDRDTKWRHCTKKSNKRSDDKLKYKMMENGWKKKWKSLLCGSNNSCGSTNVEHLFLNDTGATTLPKDNVEGVHNVTSYDNSTLTHLNSQNNIRSGDESANKTNDVTNKTNDVTNKTNNAVHSTSNTSGISKKKTCVFRELCPTFYDDISSETDGDIQIGHKPSDNEGQILHEDGALKTEKRKPSDNEGQILHEDGALKTEKEKPSDNEGQILHEDGALKTEKAKLSDNGEKILHEDEALKTEKAKPSENEGQVLQENGTLKYENTSLETMIEFNDTIPMIDNQSFAKKVSTWDLLNDADKTTLNYLNSNIINSIDKGKDVKNMSTGNFLNDGERNTENAINSNIIDSAEQGKNNNNLSTGDIPNDAEKNTASYISNDITDSADKFRNDNSAEISNAILAKLKTISNETGNNSAQSESAVPGGAKNINIIIINNRNDSLDLDDIENTISRSNEFPQNGSDDSAIITNDTTVTKSRYTLHSADDSTTSVMPEIPKEKSPGYIAPIIKPIISKNVSSTSSGQNKDGLEKTLHRTYNIKSSESNLQKDAAKEAGKLKRDEKEKEEHKPLTEFEIDKKFNESRQYLSGDSGITKNPTSILFEADKEFEQKAIETIPSSLRKSGLVNMNYAPEEIEITTYGGNADKGERCKFPFIFDGDTYFNCINTNNRGKPWCSVTDNYDRTPKWGYCSEEELAIEEQRKNEREVKNALNLPRKVKENENKPERDHDEITAKFNDDGNGLISEHRGVKTFGGNANGASCTIPFVYDGRTHMKCISKGDGTSWCATQRNYDIRPTWGYCM